MKTPGHYRKATPKMRQSERIFINLKQSLTLSFSQLRYLVARGSGTCEDSIRLCRHSVGNHCVAIGILKSKLAVVVVHGERSACDVGRCDGKGDGAL